jgi:uncharacterized protein YqgQ
MLGGHFIYVKNTLYQIAFVAFEVMKLMQWNIRDLHSFLLHTVVSVATMRKVPNPMQAKQTKLYHQVLMSAGQRF